MSENKLYTLLQSIKSESSGQGGSYYKVAAECGLKARLYDVYPKPDFDEESLIGALTPTGRKKVNGARAGTFFHALQYMWRFGLVDSNVVFDASHEDHDFVVAVQSFANYRARHQERADYFGIDISGELKLPLGPEEEAKVRSVLGDVPFTIRFDLLKELTQEHCDRIAIEHGLSLRPGRWLWDYKLLSSFQERSIDEYRTGFQSMSYPLIYNILRPEAPVEGIIFDLTARVAKWEPKHFMLIKAEYLDFETALAIVKHGIEVSAKAKAEGIAQPLACHGKWGACGLLSKCPRYGKFDDFEWNEDGFTKKG